MHKQPGPSCCHARAAMCAAACSHGTVRTMSSLGSKGGFNIQAHAGLDRGTFQGPLKSGAQRQYGANAGVAPCTQRCNQGCEGAHPAGCDRWACAGRRCAARPRCARCGPRAQAACPAGAAQTNRISRPAPTAFRRTARHGFTGVCNLPVPGQACSAPSLLGNKALRRFRAPAISLREEGVVITSFHRVGLCEIMQRI